jgi:hypothetical protein
MFSISEGDFLLSSAPSWESMELASRTGTFGVFQLFFLLISLILIILAKASNTHSYSVVFKLFFLPRKAEVRIKESWPLFSSPAFFLALNFVITFAHSIYLIIGQAQEESFQSIMISLGVSAAFFLLAFLSMSLVAFVTGVKSIYQTPMQTTWVLPQFVGLIFFALNLIWVLNPIFSDYLILLLILFFVLLTVKRILRATTFLLKKGIEWYYILLYLCTLEILPISILARFLYKMGVIKMFN